MPPSGLPTGTVSSGRDGPSATRDHGRRPRDRDVDPETRIAELERENEALRAAVEKQRRENERIVERYERLLDRDRSCDGSADEPADDEPDRTPPESTGPVARVARFLGR
jgi:hypothetical protein